MRDPRIQRRVMILVTLALTFFVALLSSPAQERASRRVAMIGITTEIAPVEARLEKPTETRIQNVVFTSGTIDGTPIVAARSGAGKVNAAITATLLVDHFSPSAVVLTGNAGAIDSEPNPGDVVIGTAVGYHDFGALTTSGLVRSPTRDPSSGRQDPAFFAADPSLLAAARQAAANVKLSAGSGVERDQQPRV